MSQVIKSYNTTLNSRSILRSLLAKRVFITITLVLVTFGVFTGAKFLANERYRVDRGVSSLPTDDTLSPIIEPQSSSPGITSQALPGAGSNSGSSQGGSIASPAPASSATPAQSASKCGNETIPTAACTAILAIEANGAKDSPYVTVDTSRLPAETKFSIDKTTWVSNADTGTVNASASVGTSTYNLKLTFTLSDGAWKVTKYE